MNKRDAVFALAALGAAPLAAIAQQPGRIWRIGMLRIRPIPELDEAFRRGLRERGYEQGHNIVIEYRWSDGDEKLFPALAAELVRLKVDLIVAGGHQAIQAAKAASSTVPIVMMIGSDPVRMGLAKSLARPGGNVTGMSAMTEDFDGKWLELLKAGLPAVRHIAVLSRTGARNVELRANVIRDAAQKLDLKLLHVEAQRAEDFEDAFAAMKTARVGALLVLGDAGFTAERRRLVELATRNRLPTMYDNKAFTEGGGLMSYGPDFADLFRRTAGHVDKLFKGAKAAELPIEQPVKFELVVNLKTAKVLGITFPPTFMLRVDRVIE